MATTDYSISLTVVTFRDILKAKGISLKGLTNKGHYQNTLRADDTILDYEKLIVPSLKDLVRVRGIALDGVPRRARLVSALKAADTPTPADAGGDAGADGVPGAAVEDGVDRAPEAGGVVDGGEGNAETAPSRVDGSRVGRPATTSTGQEDVRPDAFRKLLGEALSEAGSSKEQIEDMQQAATSAWLAAPVEGRDRINKLITALNGRQKDATNIEKEAVPFNDFVQWHEYETGDFDLCKGDRGNRPTFFDYYKELCKLQRARQTALNEATELTDTLPGGDWPGPCSVRKYLGGIETSLKRKVDRLGAQNAEAVKQAGEYDDAIQEDRVRRLGGTVRESLSDKWIGGWPGVEQGKWGSFGKVSIWVKRDSDWTVVDRIVVKDFHFTRSYHDFLLDKRNSHIWDDTALWSDQPSNPAKRIPNEVLAMYLLRGKQGSDSIVRIRNWRLRSKELMHRIYMEYCPFGIG